MYSSKSLEYVSKRTIIEDFEIDYPLLFSIMEQQAPTDSEAAQTKKRNFLIKLIEEQTGLTVVCDKAKNIYITKGESKFYPTIVAHYDTAQEYHKGFNVLKLGDWIYGFDTVEGSQCGIGADDSVGVYFAIEMLKRMPVCKVALFYGEERGCIGSKACDMTFFENSLLVSQLDRRSFENDFIVFTNGVEVFPDYHLVVIKDILDKYKYEAADGSCTDVGQLRQNGLAVASHNTACGYFNEHTDQEMIHIPSMINSMTMVYEIQMRLLESETPLVFPYEPESINSLYPDYVIDRSELDVLEKLEIIDQWTYFQPEITEDFVSDNYGLFPEEITEDRLKANPNLITPFVSYFNVGYDAHENKVININSDELKGLLKTNTQSPTLNSCCLNHGVYMPEDAVYFCGTCKRIYPLYLTGHDLFDLPDDHFGSLSDTVNYLFQS